MGFPQFLIIQEFFLADVSTIPSSTSFSAFFSGGTLKPGPGEAAAEGD